MDLENGIIKILLLIGFNKIGSILYIKDKYIYYETYPFKLFDRDNSRDIMYDVNNEEDFIIQLEELFKSEIRKIKVEKLLNDNLE